MTLKEELEIIRGDPIQVYDGDPMDIPCMEVSDAGKLCGKPVVSVHMCAYNHEPFIRQAIDGVMMQKTDFEFELVIGEDCSRDRTREICFEYQRKYPDKIRVLWWHENVSKYGGNARRVTAHCRGEYIAICEGDDYWIDPLKLQKQVDVMRGHPDVGFCFCGSRRFYQSENRYDIWNEGNATYKPGLQKKEWFFASFMYGEGPEPRATTYAGFIMTATTMVRKDLLQLVSRKYEIFNWALWLRDATLWLACSAEMDGYYIPDVVSVYRISSSGIFQNPVSQIPVRIDATIVRLFFLVTEWNLKYTDCPEPLVFALNCMVLRRKSLSRRTTYAWRQTKLKGSAFAAQWRWYLLPLRVCSMLGLYFFPFMSIVQRFAYWGVRRHGTWSVGLISKYREAGMLS